MTEESFKKAWAIIGDIPIDEDENIEEDFTFIENPTKEMTFKKGTNKDEIWHYFDDRLARGLVKTLNWDK